MTEKYTVLGAGHGGKAMAAHLAIMGADLPYGTGLLNIFQLLRSAVESNSKVRKVVRTGSEN
jgi:hypothetical protein